jgi:ElaB/YqjD/DUF883 family membrane-anchored ribosome-binding protein
MKKFVLLASLFVASAVNALAPVKTIKESALEKVASVQTFVSTHASAAQAFVASKTPVCVTNAATAIDAQITARPYCAIAIAAVVAYAVAKLTSDSSQEEDEEDYA